MKRGKWLKHGLTFLVAVAVFTPLAVWRAGDLRHVVVTADDRGGRARHGVHLAYGRDRYTVLVTGRNRLTETTNLRVALQGEPAIPFTVFSNYPPTVDLGVHDWPAFTDGRLMDCNPGEKLGLWVVLEPDKQALPADRTLAPQAYTLALLDTDGRAVVSVPVEFRDSRAPARRGGHR